MSCKRNQAMTTRADYISTACSEHAEWLDETLRSLLAQGVPASAIGVALYPGKTLVYVDGVPTYEYVVIFAGGSAMVH